MNKTRFKKVVAWTMFLGGVVGAIASGLRLIFPAEPFLITQLSWGAFWTTGIVGVFASDSALSDDDVESLAKRITELMK